MDVRIAEEYELLLQVGRCLPQARGVVVIAPHPDDEVFGCGGILALLREKGVVTTVIIATNGAAGGDNASGDLVQIREAESRTAATVLGIPEPTFWRLPDRGLGYGEELIGRITTAIAGAAADLVLLPAPTELHPDHQALALAGAEAIRRLGGNLRAVFYEINQPLPNPNLVLDITPVFELKQTAMACFSSQLAEQPYQQRITGLNRFRSYFLGPRAQAAEAFLLLEAAKLGPELAVLFDGPLAHRRKLGFAVSGDDLPLVSIIIRSMDRPTLGCALDALALQTWPNVEVIVVNAKGGDHSRLPEQCGRFPLRLINQGGGLLPRSKAANSGLAACRGQYLGFLDDDDSLDPDHLQQLMAALASLPGSALAYASVRGLAGSGSDAVVLQEFKEPGVTFARLLLGNVIPIHAVLFARRLLEQGAAFDETLDLYEDWDFWLQLTRQTTPLFVNRTTATYYTGGASAIGLGTDADTAVKQQAKERLFKKWLTLLTPLELAAAGDRYYQALQQIAEQVFQLGAKDQQLEAKDQQLEAKDQQLEAKDQQLEEKDQQLEEKDQQLEEKDRRIADLYATRSWRLTAPLRWCGTVLRQAGAVGTALTAKIRRSGGLVASCAKAVRIIAEEGPAGLQGRLHSVQEQAHNRNDYQTWVQRYDARTGKERSLLQARIARFTAPPLISVLMPVYNPQPVWLTEAIESVRSQIYPHWELCIADDASTDPEIRQLLTRYMAEDPRIKVCFRQHNGHISAASNSALALAGGQWLALFDHDDILPEHALFWVVEAIQHQPDLQLIYSDEDKIDEEGNRFGPYFKSDFNYQLFLCQNMISHLGVYRTDRVRTLGGFREGLEGSQDYDLALRVIEGLQPQHIGHIPRVLYHWRVHRQSAASGSEAKPYAHLAAVRAVREHLLRSGVQAEVEPAPQARLHNRVRYALPAPQPQVELVITAPDQQPGQLQRCLSSLLEKTTYANFRITVGMHGPVEPEVRALLARWPRETRIRILQDDAPSHDFCLCNRAVADTAADYICLLSPACEIISPDWLTEMVSHALQPGVGAVGARLLNRNGTVQHAGLLLGCGNGIAGYAHKGQLRVSSGYFGRAVLQQEYSAVTTACLLVARQHFCAVGGLDEQLLAADLVAADFCLKLRERGLRTVWTPYAELYHHQAAPQEGAAPAGQISQKREIDLLRQRWGALLDNDPCYSPNLSLECADGDFSLAWPPRTECI